MRCGPVLAFHSQLQTSPMASSANQTGSEKFAFLGPITELRAAEAFIGGQDRKILIQRRARPPAEAGARSCLGQFSSRIGANWRAAINILAVRRSGELKPPGMGRRLPARPNDE